MSGLTNIVTHLLASLTVIAQAFILVLIVTGLQKHQPFWSRWSKWALPLAFTIALVATLGSLFYSEIAHFQPCKLCWLQRIFMYPQVLTLGLALLKKNRDYILQTMLLSLIGAFIAASHVSLQWTGVSFIPCSAVGQSVSCSKEFVHTFGYITIPLMSLTAFLSLGLLALVARRAQRS